MEIDKLLQGMNKQWYRYDLPIVLSFCALPAKKAWKRNDNKSNLRVNQNIGLHRLLRERWRQRVLHLFPESCISILIRITCLYETVKTREKEIELHVWEIDRNPLLTSPCSV